MLFVAADDVGLARIANSLAFFKPELEVITFPAWDCLPYDRVSPKNDIIGLRIETLYKLLKKKRNRNRLILTTVSALLQKVPPRTFFKNSIREITLKELIDPKELVIFLQKNGFVKVDVVLESGELALRGGILDVFPVGANFPYRLDFFGDQIETIRIFDPLSHFIDPVGIFVGDPEN